jgi:hypothetical protein
MTVLQGVDMKYISLPDKIDAVSVARFWEQVQMTDECWNWQGKFGPNGYGHLRTHGTTLSAHRFSYTLHRGEITDGLVIDHLCRNRGCVNPDHLEMVTQQTNVLRGNRTLRKKVCKYGHALVGDNLMYLKTGYTRCRECARLYHKAAYRKRVTV